MDIDKALEAIKKISKQEIFLWNTLVLLGPKYPISDDLISPYNCIIVNTEFFGVFGEEKLLSNLQDGGSLYIVVDSPIIGVYDVHYTDIHYKDGFIILEIEKRFQ